MINHRLHRLKKQITQRFLKKSVYTAKPQNIRKSAKIFSLINPLRLCGFLRLCGVKSGFFRALTQILLLVTGYWLLVTGLNGCGYTTRSQIAGPWKTIYVQPFANKIDITTEKADRQRYRTYHPFLESDITKSVVDRFILDGNLQVVREKDANLALSGELIDYIRDPVRYDADNEVEEYRVTLVVKLSLKDMKKNELLWGEDSFMGDTTYFTSGSLAKTEDSALDSAIEDLARRIVERTVENW